MIPKLYYLTINITHKCNLKCKHCYNASPQEIVKDLDKELIFKLIRDAKDLGLCFLLLTGGEPLLRTDILDILKFAKSEDITIFLATNGTLLTSENVVQYLPYVAKFNISIDSADSEKHDYIRGETGAFIKALEAIQILKGHNANISISTTLHNENISELENIIALCSSLNVRLTIKRLISVGQGLKSKLFVSDKDLFKINKTILNNSDVQMKDPISILLTKSRDQKIAGCLAGTHIASVSANGNFYICTKAKYPLGNILYEDIKDIWSKNEILKKIRKREYSGKCGDCRFKSNCGGCRAAAYAENNSLLASDPICTDWLYSKITRKITVL